MPPLTTDQRRERSACGVGFVASRAVLSSYEPLGHALHALKCIEHRGACGADGVTGDGSGIMADIPFAMLGQEKGTCAVGTVFAEHGERAEQALRRLEKTFGFLGFALIQYREVPVDPSVLGKQARDSMPRVVQVLLRRPPRCRTMRSFNAQLYTTRQLLRSQLRAEGLGDAIDLISLSGTTIVYKALTQGNRLSDFYPDLQNSRFCTRFAIFHRRFSTNTSTSWVRAQPLSLIAHNGEINTITGNRSWSLSREQNLGLAPNELLCRVGASDSSSLNEMAEALKYRSSIPTSKIRWRF